MSELLKNGNIVAVIPARGGSKRIPGKNIKPFYGKPMIAYSIEAAKNSKLFERIIVSTDSEDIAKVAKQYGAETPFLRPENLADDFTGTDPVVLHALSYLREQNYAASYVCCIYPTAPFIKIEYLKQGLDTLIENDADSAFTVTSFPYPIKRALRIDEQGALKMIWPEHFQTRSQDLEEAYHDAGQFYWARVDRYIESGRFFSKNAVPIFLPRYLVQDIDTLEDWKTAELMFSSLKNVN